jgi:hypothetical protein
VSNRDDGNLDGYAALNVEDDTVNITDLSYMSNPEAIDAVLSGIVQWSRIQRCNAISLQTVNATNDLLQALGRFSFVERTGSPEILMVLDHPEGLGAAVNRLGF